MNNYIRIENKYTGFNAKIDLKSELSINLKENLSDDIILYQSHPYKIKFVTSDENIKNISLNIAGEYFEVEKKVYNNDYLIFEFSNERYFNCIWGYTQIILDIEYEGYNKIFYSKLLNIELDSNKEKSKEINHSVENMVKYVFDNNSQILRTPVRNKFSIISNNLENHQLKTLLTEIELISNIVECYQDNFEYFLTDTKYKIINKSKINSFSKVKKIDVKTIRHIVRNPHELKKVNYNTGIRYMEENFEPKNTMASETEQVYDIYENKVIIGFLKMLVLYLEDRIKRKDSYVNLYKKKNSFYRLLFSYYEFYFEQIGKFYEVLNIIYHKYKEVLKCKDFYLNIAPKPTIIFTDIYHYRQCFIVINKWFSKGNYNFEKNELMTSFVSIDQLYEYYSLLIIINEIKKLGFYLEKTEKYLYEDVNYYFSNNNTYYFNKDKDLSITLYYQPIVYSYRYANQISLYRVDGNRSYYSPDFILKISMNQKNKYIILDSKWQNRNTIKRYSIGKIMKKYILSIEATNNDKIEFVGILQGRNDNSNFYFHHNGEIASKINEFNIPRFGIINLTPEKNDFYIIKNIIQNLK